MRYPDFFLLGAAKCGTTSLYRWLAQHPDICLSQPKEPRFFATGFERGLPHYWNHCFRHYDGERLTGDASHRNLYHRRVAARIHHANSDARLIVVLRDPVDRFVSHWWHQVCRGREHLSLEDALRVEALRVGQGIELVADPGADAWGRFPDRLSDAMGLFRSYLDSGHYADQLEPYLELFPRQQLKVLLLEDLAADPQGAMDATFGFLGLDPARAHLDLTPKGHTKRIKLRPQYLRQLYANLGWQEGHLFGRLWRIGEQPPIPASVRDHLADHYRPHNLRLQRLLKRDLSGWTGVTTPTTLAA